MIRTLSASATLGIVSLLLTSGPAAAQQQAERPATGADGVTTVVPAAEVAVTREALQGRIDSLWRELGYVEDAEVADRMTRQIRRIRDRLERGDFRPGDVVLIQVRGQERLSGKVTVASNRTVELPGLDERVELGGLLYAEAGDRVREAVAGFVRDARVQVRPLTRVAVIGGVRQPGFYDVAPTTPLSELLMAAGGPSGNAKLRELEVRRGDRTLAAGEEIQPATTTLADLGVERGDEIYLPERRSGNTIRDISLVAGLLSSLTFIAVRAF